MATLFSRSRPLWLALVLGVSLTGCKKAEEAGSTPVETAPAAQPNNAAPAPAPANAAASAPTAPAETQLAESQAALQAADYEKAATTLLNLQRSQLSAQQAEAVANQMRQLQGSLAAGVANGDARAKAAADKLRQSATVR
jgi:hypothetical protein